MFTSWDSPFTYGQPARKIKSKHTGEDDWNYSIPKRQNGIDKRPQNKKQIRPEFSYNPINPIQQDVDFFRHSEKPISRDRIFEDMNKNPILKDEIFIGETENPIQRDRISAYSENNNDWFKKQYSYPEAQNKSRRKKKRNKNNYKYDFTNAVPNSIHLLTFDEISRRSNSLKEPANFTENNDIADRNEYLKKINEKYGEVLETDKFLYPNHKDENTLGSMLFNSRMIIENPAMALLIVGNIAQGKSTLVKWFIELYLRVVGDENFTMNIFSNSASMFYGKFKSKPLIKNAVKKVKNKKGKTKNVVDKKNQKNRLELLRADLLAEADEFKNDPTHKFEKRLLILDDVLTDILGKKDSLDALMEILKNRYHWNTTVLITNQNFVGLRNSLKSLFDFFVFVSKTDNVFALRQLNTFLNENEKGFAKDIFEKMATNHYGLVYKRDIKARGGIFYNSTKEYKEKKTLWWNKPMLFAIVKDFVPINIKDSDIKIPYRQFFNNKLMEIKDKWPEKFKEGYIERT